MSESVIYLNGSVFLYNFFLKWQKYVSKAKFTEVSMKQKILICMLFLFFLNSTVFAYSKPGSRGNEVLRIQNILIEKGYYTGTADGIYGALTRRAVKKYQADNGLEADGIAGRETLSSLKLTDSKDVYLLARVINGEARGESFEGQVAVGAVVLNRVRHASFPDTLKDVIYQPGAFSAVDDGQINKSVSESCIKAAYAALSGQDPTNGAVFYYNPETATCKWIRTRKVIKRIGNHLFCA